MNHRTFSLICLSTLDLDRTCGFYQRILGFEPVAADTLEINDGGRIRHVFFDFGRNQLIAYMEPDGVPKVQAGCDAGVDRGLGVAASFNHFAFETDSPAALACKRDELRAKSVKVTDIVAHARSLSIYFKDPNGLSLEYCCSVQDPRKDDALLHERFMRGAPRWNSSKTVNAKIPQVQSSRRKRTA